jgi:SAM-dependent methyltransferase
VSQPSRDDDVTDAGVFRAVLDGYEAVYEAIDRSPTFTELWRSNAYGDDFPPEFAHIGFLTEAEAEPLVDLLLLQPGDRLVDVACGTGGPGLWAARRTGAELLGLDPSSSALAQAMRRAAATGLAARSRFAAGTFERTGCPDQSAKAIMTVEAFQYAPDKRAAVAELHRVLEPGGHLAIVAFEVDDAGATELPVLGVDPVADYGPLLTGAGFDLVAYDETPGWRLRVEAAFSAVLEAGDQLRKEMGERAAAAVLAEAMLTVRLRPYRRRVAIVATRRG